VANDGFVQLPADGSGKLVDMSQVTTTSGTVDRQRVVIGDDSKAAGLAGVDDLTNELKMADANVPPLLSAINRKLGIIIIQLHSLKQTGNSDSGVDAMLAQIWQEIVEGTHAR
jgi:hypothetical protein